LLQPIDSSSSDPQAVATTTLSLSHGLGIAKIPLRISKSSNSDARNVRLVSMSYEPSGKSVSGSR
jgi:hypothetical protein